MLWVVNWRTASYEVRRFPTKTPNADLLAHGLIRASFVPPEPIQEMRISRRRGSN
jgi:hypothetical protein